MKSYEKPLSDKKFFENVKIGPSVRKQCEYYSDTSISCGLDTRYASGPDFCREDTNCEPKRRHNKPLDGPVKALKEAIDRDILDSTLPNEYSDMYEEVLWIAEYGGLYGIPTNPLRFVCAYGYNEGYEDIIDHIDWEATKAHFAFIRDDNEEIDDNRHFWQRVLLGIKNRYWELRYRFRKRW